MRRARASSVLPSMDGSVRCSISETVDAVWRALGARQGGSGEPIASGSAVAGQGLPFALPGPPGEPRAPARAIERTRSGRSYRSAPATTCSSCCWPQGVATTSIHDSIASSITTSVTCSSSGRVQRHRPAALDADQANMPGIDLLAAQQHVQGGQHVLGPLPRQRAAGSPRKAGFPRLLGQPSRPCPGHIDRQHGPAFPDQRSMGRRGRARCLPRPSTYRTAGNLPCRTVGRKTVRARAVLALDANLLDRVSLAHHSQLRATGSAIGRIPANRADLGEALIPRAVAPEPPAARQLFRSLQIQVPHGPIAEFLHGLARLGHLQSGVRLNRRLARRRRRRRPATSAHESQDSLARSWEKPCLSGYSNRSTSPAEPEDAINSRLASRKLSHEPPMSRRSRAWPSRSASAWAPAA